MDSSGRCAPEAYRNARARHQLSADGKLSDTREPPLFKPDILNRLEAAGSRFP